MSRPEGGREREKEREIERERMREREREREREAGKRGIFEAQNEVQQSCNSQGDGGKIQSRDARRTQCRQAVKHHGVGLDFTSHHGGGPTDS